MYAANPMGAYFTAGRGGRIVSTAQAGVGQALAGRPLGGVAGGAAVLAVYALVIGGAGYIAGKAMAPSSAQAGTYKWGGAIANMVLPGVGMGIVGLFAGAGR